MDENNPGATPPTEPTPTPTSSETPEIPVVDNTQPTPDISVEPTPESVPAQESSASDISSETMAPAPETPTPDASASENAPTDVITSDAPVLSGTPRSLGGSTPTGSAEAGGPAAFGSSTIASKPKSKILPIALVLVLVLGLGGAASAFYFLNRSNIKDTPDISSDQSELEESAPTASRYALSDNSLSDFDLAFLRLERSGENSDSNKVYSPLSIKYALAMLADASAGETKTQITDLIGNYQPKAYLNSTNRSLANAMFINNTFADQVKDTYTSAISEKYNAEIRLDSFSTPDTLNTWVSDKTLGIITDFFDESLVNPSTSYILTNALAIDMSWKNQIQCADNFAYDESTRSTVRTSDATCISDYNAKASASHENFSNPVARVRDESGFPKISFNGVSDVKSAQFAVTANKYDILKELGEDTIRTTVAAEYEKWLAEINADPNRYEDSPFDLNTYMAELGENYGKFSASTDFAYSVTDSEKIFSKDLREYDGSTLEYIAVMPTATSLSSYLSSLSAASLSEKLSNLTTPSADIYKEGVVTKLTGFVPFFNFNYNLNLIADLEALGVTDVFDSSAADLSGMLDIPEEVLSSDNRPAIGAAAHIADIDFTNDGIKAAAVTAFAGLGAGGGEIFTYDWDVPVEEIDLTFDQPFFFLIRDKATGEVWFTGEVSSLSATS